ncbi:xanthine dehydrogenase family protein molybdopterin-binding subunit [Microvenator marinus]|uniref:xanthine dehydrogenase family protein molybdopterin-binding subunit n=1 Tax=Microvenator marinus TaxID=2600177 RepID=UPI00201B8E14|nr:molybdopterin cofactor-binding domain-containing protein [Microvenator marinus]
MNFSRREFLKVSLTASGVLVMGVHFAGCSNGRGQMREEAESTGVFRPNAIIAIQPDGFVQVAVAKTEMGQGVFTSHAMLVAEELEVPLEMVRSYHPEAGPDYQTFGVQITGGSSSLKESFVPIREAAAAAREMLVLAAASAWGVPASECEAREGAIHHKDKSVPIGDLTRAASTQEIPSSPRIKTKDFKVIGQAKTRVDALEKVKGEAVFGIDVSVPGMLRAVVIRPPVMGSTLKSFDASAAEKETGVEAIFEFERGVAVVAQKYWQAMRASRLVKVEWNDDSKLKGLNSAELASEAARESRKSEPDIPAGLKVFEAEYASPYLSHSPMEPMNAAAWVKGDSAEIWAPLQWQSAAQGDIAMLLGIDRAKVKIHTTMLGGGFGRRLMIDYVVEAVLVARKLKKPVHVIWSREDDMRGGYYRPINHTRVVGGLDESGRIQALHYHTLSQSLLDLRDWLPGILPEWLPRIARTMAARAAGSLVESDMLPNALATEGASETAYRIPEHDVKYTQIRVDVPVSFWRSVGHSFNAFAMESFIDELAAAADKDPLAFRLEHLPQGSRERNVLEKAAELADFSGPRDSGWGKGIAVHKSFDTYCAEVVEARVTNGAIEVRRVWCVVDCGIVVNPDIVRQQMESCIIQGISAAIHQEITFENGHVIQGNFDDYKFIRLHETPEIFVDIVESNEAPTGVGEPGLPPVAPALAGAIFEVTGQRLRRMPFLQALKDTK